MADGRRLTDLIHGHVGQFTYIPREDESRQPGIAHTSRNTSSTAQHFQVIGSSAELYAPSKSRMPEGSSRLWQERREQRRWLLKSHPQAFMGISVTQELLEANMERFRKVESETSDRTLLALGQITKMHDAKRVYGTPAIAATTGESGELLRLAHIDEAKWKWNDDGGAKLCLSVIDPEDQEEEVIWASDGLSISQVKFATSTSGYDSVRWLLVQKQTSTTVLQPLYHKVPVAQKQLTGSFPQQRLSRVDPNPLLTLSHEQTGGNAHMDVAFNPGAKDSPPQIAIIDECGYWSAWNVVGRFYLNQTKMRAVLHSCGHIFEGLLESIPQVPSYPAEKHGVLFVGVAEIDSFWEAPSQGQEGGAARSQHILLWNRERIQVIDLVSKTSLAQFPNITTFKGKPDWILDVQLSPINQNHVFVLTRWHLHWIDLFAPSSEEGMPSKPSIILSCPHASEVDGRKMTICRASEDEADSSMVFIYSDRSQQLEAYWFEVPMNSLPQWHRQILTLPRNDESQTTTAIQSIQFQPAKLTGAGSRSNGIGSLYQRQGVRFYQCSMLRKDLSVRYCICASSPERGFEITLPTTRMGQSKSDREQRWKRKRKHFLRHMGDAFVLPDSLDDALISGAVQPNSLDQQESTALVTSPTRGPVFLKLDKFCSRIHQTLFDIPGDGQNTISQALISAIRGTIENGSLQGRLPLTTWLEVSKALEPDEYPESDGSGGQHDMFDLLEMNDEQTVVTVLGRETGPGSIGGLLGLAELTQYFSQLWLEPLAEKLSEEDQQVRRRWISSLATEFFLSNNGVLVQDTTLLGSGNMETMAESQGHMQSSIPIKSSQSSAVSIPSSPPATPPASATTDPAIRRLQLLSPALQLDKMSGTKQSSVLSYWPTECGVSTQEYISSVATASDRKFDDARQRLQKIEARRRAQAEKYKIPGFKRKSKLPAGDAGETLPSQPVPMPVPMQIMSSQQAPGSSQSQGFLGPSVAMSQPVSGAFGDRKKAKKGKRKSGFR